MKQQVQGLIALVEGCFLAALGVVFLQQSGLVGGGTTGLALLADGLIPTLSFGPLFFLINLPFYWLGLRYLGRALILRTFICVTLMALMTEGLQLVRLEVPYPLLSAVIAGLLLAFGMSILFKAGGSLGGINILGLFAQQRFGVAASRVILATDLMIMLGSLLLFGWQVVLYSAVCVTVLGFTLGRHFKPAKRAPVEARTA
ncbi:YitT family protein [Motiliproteus sp. SC1-56]|uniref:YitT family protein n=1 Tax=Motiliproteus sp. SC1-56 TaxID=2799565 RepID=UPI001A8CF82F|nr:YitT family protein [Motiliproteus sp. SC1-56]